MHRGIMKAEEIKLLDTSQSLDGDEESYDNSGIGSGKRRQRSESEDEYDGEQSLPLLQEPMEMELSGLVPASEAEEDPKKAKRRIMKNVLCISVAWLFLFTGFQSLSNLQSSLNRIEGLGVASLTVIYSTILLSCMFAPAFMINAVGLKWTIVISIFCYITYMVANFYAQWYTLIPTAALLGLAASPLWIAQAMYFTDSGIVYAGLSGSETSEVVINWFFGIFFTIFQCSQIVGNLVASTVLKVERNDNATYKEVNSTFVIEFCGAADCPSNQPDNDNWKRPDPEKIYLLCGIFVACALTGAGIVASFVDNFSRKKAKTSKKFSCDLFIASLKHAKNPIQLMLIPITLFNGLEIGYIFGDYTKSFVTCVHGIDQVGYVMICYGVFSAIFSLLCGRLVACVGRVPLFVFAIVTHAALIVTMIIWKPNVDQKAVVFILAGAWGMADAVWSIQLTALYGVLFSDNQEAAFSNRSLWESTGFVIAYASSTHLCTSSKLYHLLTWLSVGVFFYTLIEINQRRKVNPATSLSASLD